MKTKRSADGRVWEGRDAFDGFSATDLNNGLSLDDNSALTTTPHIDQAIVLILRWLVSVCGDVKQEVEHPAGLRI